MSLNKKIIIVIVIILLIGFILTFSAISYTKSLKNQTYLNCSSPLRPIGNYTINPTNSVAPTNPYPPYAK